MNKIIFGGGRFDPYYHLLNLNIYYIYFFILIINRVKQIFVLYIFNIEVTQMFEFVLLNQIGRKSKWELLRRKKRRSPCK